MMYIFPFFKTKKFVKNGLEKIEIQLNKHEIKSIYLNKYIKFIKYHKLL